jgi:predicted PhzF superfamily epimerase YddE/YHI9
VVRIELLRVFTNADGAFGNPLAVVLDGSSVSGQEERQNLASRLGYSETLFFDDLERGDVQIFTPALELPFAGHPTVGAAWIMARELGSHPDVIRTRSGDAPTWHIDGQVWVRAALAAAPPWWHERLPSSKAVDALTGPPTVGQDAVQVWAWQDEQAGHVRARVFGERFGVFEDEACGAASMRLAAALGRSIRIDHGVGSVVLAKPGPPGSADVGGQVASDGPILAP